MKKKTGGYICTEKERARKKLEDEVWSDGKVDSSVSWMYVSFLREKLKSIQANVILDGDFSGPFILKVI